MKKILNIFLVLIFSLTLVSCSNSDKGTVDGSVRNFDEDGILTISISKDKELVETITSQYEGEYVTEIKYTIYEKDEDTLNIDKGELAKLEPDMLEANDDMTLTAVFNTGFLEDKIPSLTKTNINGYVDTLINEYPDYDFKFKYEKIKK